MYFIIILFFVVVLICRLFVAVNDQIIDSSTALQILPQGFFFRFFFINYFEYTIYYIQYTICTTILSNRIFYKHDNNTVLFKTNHLQSGIC